MKTRFTRTARALSIGALLPAVVLLSACDIDQTQEAKLPDVNVDAEPGQLPKYEVTQTQEGKLPDVDVSAEGGQLPKFEVETADVDVGTKTVEITVPTVDVQMPGDAAEGEAGTQNIKPNS